jgi:ferredoxin-NADP reductase
VCQNVNIKLKIENKLINKTYTITSIPNKYNFEITIKKMGYVSNYFFNNMEKGKQIYLNDIFGEFSPKDFSKKLLFISGGLNFYYFRYWNNSFYFNIKEFKT